MLNNTEIQIETIEGLIFKTIDIPALPQSVLQLITAQDPDIGEITRLLSIDIGLTTRLLRIANSAIFERSWQVATIPDAIGVIGLNAVKSLIAGSSIKDIHRKPNEMERVLWRHALWVAVCAGELSRFYGLDNHDEYFTAGMLHDIGKIVMLKGLDDYADIYNAGLDGGAFLNAESVALNYTHCMVGGYIARKWRLPRSLEAVIESHHDDDIELDKSPYGRFIRVVRLSDRLFWDMNRTCDGFKVSASDLDMEEAAFETFKARVTDLYRRLLEIF